MQKVARFHLFLAALMLIIAAITSPLSAQSPAEMQIESWTQRDADMELRLVLPATFGRRYRIEVSTNLTSWETRLVTEPSFGSALTVVVTTPAAIPHFFRASLFDWEELRAELEAARDRWRASELVTYQFLFHWRCVICHPNFRTPSQVDVRDGAITGVTQLTTGETLPPDQWVHYTVEELFDWIEGKLAQHPEVMQVEFDPVLGHPISGYYDLTSLMNDEEMGFALYSLSP